VCYGNCFAATSAFGTGYNFGRRIPNVFEPALFAADLLKMPQGQGYVRNGWNSDPSWNWTLAGTISEYIRSSNRLPVLLTKCFIAPSAHAVAQLVKSEAELRMTVSAFDSRAALARRLYVCEEYRAAGGIAIPVVVTTVFRDPRLNAYQDEIVDQLGVLDLPSAENSLRLHPTDKVVAEIDTERTRPIAESDEVWCGRLHPDSLPVPTITSVASRYRGLRSGYLSRLGRDELTLLFDEPIPTSDEVLTHRPIPKPRQAGIPHPMESNN
jgi:hypothetical protein